MFLSSNSGMVLTLLIMILHCSPLAQDQPPPDEGNAGIQEDLSAERNVANQDGVRDECDYFSVHYKCGDVCVWWSQSTALNMIGSKRFETRRYKKGGA